MKKSPRDELKRKEKRKKKYNTSMKYRDANEKVLGTHTHTHTLTHTFFCYLINFLLSKSRLMSLL